MTLCLFAAIPAFAGPSRIIVTPGTVFLHAPGAKAEVSVTVLDRSGAPIPDVAVSWTSSDSQVAKVTTRSGSGAVAGAPRKFIIKATGHGAATLLAVCKNAMKSVHVQVGDKITDEKGAFAPVIIKPKPKHPPIVFRVIRTGCFVLTKPTLAAPYLEELKKGEKVVYQDNENLRFILVKTKSGQTGWVNLAFLKRIE